MKQWIMVAALVACGKGDKAAPLAVTGTAHTELKADTQVIVVDVKTEPDVELNISAIGGKSAHAKADASGAARVELPMSTYDVEVSAGIGLGKSARHADATIKVARDAKVAEGGPPHLKWNQAAFECSRPGDCKGGFNGDRVVLYEAKPKTLVGVGVDKPVEVTVGSVGAPVPIGSLAAAPVPDILDSAQTAKQLAIPLVVVTPDGTTYASTMPMAYESIARQVEHVFSEVAVTPVKFPDDRPAPAKGKRSVWVDVDLGQRVVGPAKTVAEIDLVATGTTVEKKRACGTFSDGKGVQTRVEVTAIDFKVALIDRRTGKQVATTSLNAPAPACPTQDQYVKGPLANTTTFGGGLADMGPLTSWLDQQR